MTPRRPPLETGRTSDESYSKMRTCTERVQPLPRHRVHVLLSHLSHPGSSLNSTRVADGMPGPVRMSRTCSPNPRSRIRAAHAKGSACPQALPRCHLVRGRGHEAAACAMQAPGLSPHPPAPGAGHRQQAQESTAESGARAREREPHRQRLVHHEEGVGRHTLGPLLHPLLLDCRQGSLCRAPSRGCLRALRPPFTRPLAASASPSCRHHPHQPATSPPLCKSRRVNAQSRCATRSSGTPTTGARTNRRGRRRGRMRRKRGRVVRGSVQAGDRVPGASLSPAPVQCVARLLDEVRLVHGSDTWRQVVSASRQLPSHSTRSILVQSCALRARRRARPRRQQKNYTDEACQGCTPCNNSQRQCARHEGRGELGGHLDAFCHIFGGHVAGCGATGAP